MTFDNLYHKLDCCLKECRTLLDNSNGGYELLTRIEETQKKLHQPMQLAIIGKISSSKSTLVNAILGEAEVVRTGQMEETFNVSWLKYGSVDNDIKVYFKDGTVTNVPNKEWAAWTSHQIENSLKENVKYIEVFYPNEILKSINIIDTPGLDALSEIDSKNTIDFLKTVKPDAVILVFTKSIAESTLSILQDFQASSIDSFSFNPLNALGVLAKADMMWSSFTPDKDVLKDAERVIKSTLYDKYSEVKHSLFSILPVSALVGLGSYCLSKEDITDIKKLSDLEDAIICEMLSSPDFLMDESYNSGVNINRIKILYAKFGLYGIYHLIQAYRSEVNSIEDLKVILLTKSGFNRLLSTIISHFGERASLIKCQNSIRSIITLCERERNNFHTPEEIANISEISRKVISLLLSLTEYTQWDYLSKIYSGEILIEDEIVDEFKRLCGEQGHSLWERLGLSNVSNLTEISEHINKRALYWQREYNLFSIIDPQRAGLYWVMIKSYNHLLEQIELILSEAKAAIVVVNQAEAFFGKENLKKLVKQ